MAAGLVVQVHQGKDWVGVMGGLTPKLGMLEVAGVEKMVLA
jgi:hypothetical protein